MQTLCSNWLISFLLILLLLLSNKLLQEENVPLIRNDFGKGTKISVLSDS